MANGSGYQYHIQPPAAAPNQSPTSLSRTIEKVFDDSQYTGVLNLSGRKLKEYPRAAAKYDLVDTTVAG